MTFWNAREGGVELVKVNAADKTERLSDAVFEIRKASDDAIVDTVTTGDTGTVFAPLAEGDYYAVEQESPSGFKLDSTRHYFSVKDGEVTQEVLKTRPSPASWYTKSPQRTARAFRASRSFSMTAAITPSTSRPPMTGATPG